MTCFPGPSGRPLEIALVNNMPDQALSATLAQFSRLVRAGAIGRRYNLRAYTLPGLHRSDSARKYLKGAHEDIEALYERGADGLIVTGSEPKAKRIQDEPYWKSMQELVEWARSHTVSTIWSCLAAHAATLHLTGLERRRMPQKLSGVYVFERTGDDWTGAQGQTAVAPHSRYNELVEKDLERYGFRIASHSRRAGVNMFWREEPSLFVFLQGHPEYEQDTLSKEFRRDMLRFLLGQQSDLPRIPENIYSTETNESLAALHLRLTSGLEKDPAASLAAALSSAKCNGNWREDSEQLFRCWFDRLLQSKAPMRVSA